MAPQPATPAFRLGWTLPAPGYVTHSGRAAQPLRARWEAAVRLCGPLSESPILHPSTHPAQAKTGVQFQVPYLVDPNTGVALFESLEIIEYLDAVYTAD